MYLKYHDFKEVKHTPLRAYNRAVVFSNLLEEDGARAAEDYANIFNEWERKQMAIILHAVKTLGNEEVKRQVTEGVEFTYDPREDFKNTIES